MNSSTDLDVPDSLNNTDRIVSPVKCMQINHKKKVYFKQFISPSKVPLPKPRVMSIYEQSDTSIERKRNN